VPIVGQLGNQQCERLKVSCDRELPAVSRLKPKVANEQRHGTLRGVVISTVANGWALGQDMRARVEQLRRHCVERFHYAGTARATGDDFGAGSPVTHDKGSVRHIHGVRAIHDNFAAQVSGEPKHSRDLLPMHGEHDHSRPSHHLAR
jgi:hypothetical protein